MFESLQQKGVTNDLQQFELLKCIFNYGKTKKFY